MSQTNTYAGPVFKPDFGIFHDISDDSYRRGYNDGNAAGHQAGYEAGQQTGYAEGQLSGYAEGHQAGYEAGQLSGIEQGEQAEYDRFWDVCQDNGNRTSYQYAFAGTGWTDANYAPKYPIICTSGSSESIFRDNPNITDTKQPIEVRVDSASYIFLNCRNLKTIPYIGFFGVTKTNSVFSGCTRLENITVGGEINSGIGFADCSKLTDASVQSVIDHLGDLTGQTAGKITFHATVGARMTDAQKAAVTAKNWTLVY